MITKFGSTANQVAKRILDFSMINIYGDVFSGNCYKVKLLMHFLDQDYQWIDVDILKKESRADSFLAKNPNGKIPLLELADGQCLAESNAILHYLAEGTDWLPNDRLKRAQVLQWQFFEQYSHEPYIAVARYIKRYLGNPPDRQEDLQRCYPPGRAALKIMDQHLSQRDYFVDDHMTVADLSLFAYTHVADEGGFDLKAYPSLRAWIGRIEAHPRFITIG